MVGEVKSRSALGFASAPRVQASEPAGTPGQCPGALGLDGQPRTREFGGVCVYCQGVLFVSGFVSDMVLTADLFFLFFAFCFRKKEPCFASLGEGTVLSLSV